MLVGLNGNGMSKISYTALVLDDESRSKLFDYFSPYIPKNFEKIGHHMTLNMGEIKEEFEKYLGMTVQLKVVKIGISDLAMAAMVDTIVPTLNAIPHVTIAINREAGGKPFSSSEITNWKPIQFAIELTGTVKELDYNHKEI